MKFAFEIEETKFTGQLFIFIAVLWGYFYILKGLLTDAGILPTFLTKKEEKKNKQKAKTSEPTIVYIKGFGGRAEPIFSLLEDAGVSYKKKLLPYRPLKSGADLQAAVGQPTGFAMPVVINEDWSIGQTTALLSYFGEVYGYDADDCAESKATTLMLANNSADIMVEIFKNFKTMNLVKDFCKPGGRLFKWLQNMSVHLKGEYFMGRITYADFAFLNVVRFIEACLGSEGVKCFESITALVEWKSRMMARPKLRAFLSTTDPIVPAGMLFENNAGKKAVEETPTIVYFKAIGARVDPILYLFEDAEQPYNMQYTDFPPLTGKKLEALVGQKTGFAQPVVYTNDMSVGQTTAILSMYGKKFGYDGDDDTARAKVLQLALNAADVLVEIFKVDQASFAGFTGKGGRLWQWLQNCEGHMRGDYFVGKLTYAEFAWLNALRWGHFRFGPAMDRLLEDFPKMQAMEKRVLNREKIAKFLANAAPVLPSSKSYENSLGKPKTKPTLVYWPGFGGRVEPVQFLLEDAGAPYDMKYSTGARNGKDLQAFIGQATGFAQPCVIDEDWSIGQTVALLQYFGQQHGYDMDTPKGKASVLMMANNAADILGEAIKQQDLSAAQEFVKEGGRLRSWLDYMTEHLAGDYLMGAKCTYADFLLLSVARMIEVKLGPLMDDVWKSQPALVAWRQNMESRKRLKTFLDSAPVALPEGYSYEKNLKPKEKTIPTLVYMPGFGGRVEPVQLLLEDAKEPYNMKFSGGGVSGKDLQAFVAQPTGFAQPCVIDENWSIGQTTALLQYFGQQLGYDMETPKDRGTVLMNASNAADILVEALQKSKDLKSAKEFVKKGGRLHHWLDYMTEHLQGDFLMGEKCTYADFALLNVFRLADVKFGPLITDVWKAQPKLVAWRKNMESRENLKSFLASAPPALPEAYSYEANLKPKEKTPVTLFYPAGLGGRVEPIACLLDDAGVPFSLKHTDGFISGKQLEDEVGIKTGFAQPVTREGDFSIGQVTALLAYYGKMYGYDAESPQEQAKVLFLACNAADILTEAFGKAGDLESAQEFAENRLRVWLDQMEGHFVGQFFMGDQITYADFAFLQVARALDRRLGPLVKDVWASHEKLVAWKKTMESRKNIQERLKIPVLPPAFAYESLKSKVVG